MNSFAKGILLGALLALGLFYGASLLPGKKTESAVLAPEKGRVGPEEYLSVKGENTLLKKMLGQVEGRIIILGPVGKKAQVQGKLVWDKTMQQGFLHAEGLDAAITYQLVLKPKQGAEVVVMEQSGPTVWQTQFKTPQRILDLGLVEIRGKTSKTEGETLVYARGVVPED